MLVYTLIWHVMIYCTVLISVMWFLQYSVSTLINQILAKPVNPWRKCHSRLHQDIYAVVIHVHLQKHFTYYSNLNTFTRAQYKFKKFSLKCFVFLKRLRHETRKIGLKDLSEICVEFFILCNACFLTVQLRLLFSFLYIKLYMQRVCS